MCLRLTRGAASQFAVLAGLTVAPVACQSSGQRPSSESEPVTVAAADSLALVMLADSFVTSLRRGDTLALHGMVAEPSQLPLLLQVFEMRTKVVPAWEQRLVKGVGPMSDGRRVVLSLEVPVRSLPDNCYSGEVQDRVSFGYQRLSGGWRISFISAPIC